MRHIPNGIYRQGDSVVHRLDAAVKMILFIILSIAAVTADSIGGYALIIAFTVLLVLLSDIGFYAAAGNIVRLSWFFITVFIMNLCFFSSENAWVSFWIFNPSYDGMMQGIKVTARVIVFVVLSNILNSSTPPAELTNALEKILSPLSLLKIPTGQIALILSVAVQFIPTLLEEADMIKKAQLSRGAGLDSRRLTEKARAVLPMVVPVFTAAFRRADELSLAMEARGYSVDIKNSRKKQIHIGFAEIISFFVCTLVCAVQIFVF